MSSINEIREIDSFVESMIDIERSQEIEMGEAFQNYEEVFQQIYNALEDGNDYIHLKVPEEQTVSVLEDEDVLKGWRNNLYRIEKDNIQELEKFEERFQEYSTQGYDELELIARYKKEAEAIGKTPSSRDARKSNHMPTAISYNNSFEKFANAKWRAGFKVHEKYGTELTLEQLKDEIHGQNENKTIYQYDIPTAPEITSSETAPASKTFRNNEEIGDYEKALKIIGFQKLRKHQEGEWTDEKWRPNLVKAETQEKIQEFLENNPSLGTHFLNSQNLPQVQLIRDIAASDTQNSVRANNKHQGKFYKALEEIGLLENWSGPRYIVDAEPEEFEEVEDQISEKTQTDEVIPRESDITNLMKRASIGNRAPTMEEISENPEAPCGETYFYHLGSYNNAVFRAGLKPNVQFKPDSELEAALIEIYHALERRPTRSEVEEMTGINAELFDDRHEDGLEGMMDDLNIPTFEEELDHAFEVMFGEEDSSIEEQRSLGNVYELIMSD